MQNEETRGDDEHTGETIGSLVGELSVAAIQLGAKIKSTDVGGAVVYIFALFDSERQARVYRDMANGRIGDFEKRHGLSRIIGDCIIRELKVENGEAFEARVRLDDRCDEPRESEPAHSEAEMHWERREQR
jgi:hypothetical protein